MGKKSLSLPGILGTLPLSLIGPSELATGLIMGQQFSPDEPQTPQAPDDLDPGAAANEVRRKAKKQTQNLVAPQAGDVLSGGSTAATTLSGGVPKVAGALGL